MNSGYTLHVGELVERIILLLEKRKLEMFKKGDFTLKFFLHCCRDGMGWVHLSLC